MINADYEAIINANQGVRLDIGCGADKHAGYLGIDIAPYPGVDIVWNIEHTPWPFLKDESVLGAIASHVLEHLNPSNGDHRVDGLKRLLVEKGIATPEEVDEYCGLDGSPFINFMNELWRVMKPNGQFAFVVPHASSAGYQQDPTHINMINQNTMFYFDPLHESGLYRYYQPKPWHVELNYFDMNGNVECVLRKLRDDPSYHTPNPTDITDETAKDFVKTVRTI